MSGSDNTENIERTLNEVKEKVNQIADAFPRDDDGAIDARGHREYHEALIRSAKLQEDFWRQLRYDLIRKGLWAVIIVVCGLVVTGIAAKLGIPKG